MANMLGMAWLMLSLSTALEFEYHQGPDGGQSNCYLFYGQVSCSWNQGVPQEVGRYPIDLGTDRTAVALSCGTFHACAVLDDGGVKCWADRNTHGYLLGLGIPVDQTFWAWGDDLPYVDLGTGVRALDISVSYKTACALLDTNQVKCWGEDYYGTLGLCMGPEVYPLRVGDEPGEMGDNLPAVDLGSSNRNMVRITAGTGNHCVQFDDGAWKCWAMDHGGCRSDLAYNVHPGWTADSMGDNLTDVYFGQGRTASWMFMEQHSCCAIVGDGDLICVGGRSYPAALAQGSTQAYSWGDNGPPPVNLGTGRKAAMAVDFEVGATTIILLDNGDIKTFGMMSYYTDLTGGARTQHVGDEPGEVGDARPALDWGGGQKATAIWGGRLRACAVLTDSTVRCFGNSERCYWARDVPAIVLPAAPSTTTVTRPSTLTATTGTATTTTATTTATATSSTTASSTTTMTTSSTREVTCSLARLYCPLPADLAAGTYQIEGNESSPPGSCQMQGSGAARYFDVAIDECNVTQTQVPGGLNLSVTLIPATGTLVFAGDPLPTLICGCFYDSLATVGTVAAVEVQTETRDITGGSASFNATLRLFADDTFSEHLLPGASYPTASARFYLEIATDNEEEVIGVPECRVAPTNSEEDLYQQDVRTDYCDNPIFEPALLSGPGVDNQTAKVRWSIVKFKFSGFTHVYVTCVVTRCSTPPCGACTGQGSGRRLDGSEQESAVEAVAVDLVLPPGAYMLLPGEVPEDGMLAKLTSPAEPPRAGASGVSANLTIYGFPLIADVQRFVDQFRSAVSPYLEAQVYQVWQVHGFNGSSEVTRVGFYCTPDGAAESILAPVVQDHAESTRFISELLQELGFPNQRADLMRMDVNSANLTAPHATLPTAPAPSPGAAEVPAAIIAIIAVVGAALIAVAAVALVLWWRKVRTRASQRTMGKESAATNALEPTEKEPARAAVEDPGAVENSACESVIVSDPGNGAMEEAAGGPLAEGEAREGPVAADADGRVLHQIEDRRLSDSIGV